MARKHEKKTLAHPRKVSHGPRGRRALSAPPSPSSGRTLLAKAILDSTADAILTVDEAGTVWFFNSAAERLFGYSRDEVVGRDVAKLVPAHADQAREQIVSPEVGPTVLRGGERELRALHQNGAGFPVALRIAETMHAGSRIFIWVLQDITHRKRAEVEQTRLQTQLMVSDRMASVGTLAAGVAHEINNPLAVVIGNLTLAVRQVESLAECAGEDGITEVRDELRDAQEAAERVSEIVRDLKIFSRTETEARGPVDVRHVLESSLRMAWNEIRHRATLVKQYGEIPPVDANEARLGQVFLNLIVNAAQAIPEGRASDNQIRVTTRADRDGFVLVEIGDTGAGIPAEVLPRLFTPFFTTKPVGVGTGLGLSICHRIVTSLGGEISVDSEAGRGTTVSVRLRATAEPSRGKPCVPMAPSRASRRGRVLVVDDEAIVGSMLRRALAPDHDVTVVTRAEEAVELIEKGLRFDVILCDLMMPQVTGMDMHERLVLVAPEQAERMIFVTGGAFTPRAKEFLDRMQGRCVEKPFEVVRLRALVNERVG